MDYNSVHVRLPNETQASNSFGEIEITPTGFEYKMPNSEDWQVVAVDELSYVDRTKTCIFYTTTAGAVYCIDLDATELSRLTDLQVDLKHGLAGIASTAGSDDVLMVTSSSGRYLRVYAKGVVAEDYPVTYPIVNAAVINSTTALVALDKSRPGQETLPRLYLCDLATGTVLTKSSSPVRVLNESMDYIVSAALGGVDGKTLVVVNTEGEYMTLLEKKAASSSEYVAKGTTMHAWYQCDSEGIPTEDESGDTEGDAVSVV